jgi:hypothetical protein
VDIGAASLRSTHSPPAPIADWDTPTDMRPAYSKRPVDDAQKARALRVHDTASARGETGYIDPATGLLVLTAHYLRQRGYCCGAGCRHCPYTEAEQQDAGRPNTAEVWRA